MISRQHTKIFLLWTSWARTPQFKSPSASLSFMVLLGWPFKPHLKHLTAFLIQNPECHIPPNKSMVRPVTAIPLIPNCLVRVSIAATKHHDQKASWEGKGCWCLYFYNNIHHWRRSGRKPSKAESWRQEPVRDHAELLLTALLHMASSASFLTGTRLMSPGNPPCTMGWAHSIND